MPASALMNVMIAAARKAGRSLARDFGEVEQLQVSIKGPGNFVSAADHKAEDDHLPRAGEGAPRLQLPHGGARRGRRRRSRRHRWIVDPLDGTTNFLHGVPLFAISIGLGARGPDRRRASSTTRSPMSCSPPRRARAPTSTIAAGCASPCARTLSDALVTTGIPHLGRPGHVAFKREIKEIIKHVAGVRRTGSAALDLAWVAAGRFDAYWERGIKPWDMAAGIVLVREAGGAVTDLRVARRCSSKDEVLATNSTLQKEFLPLLAGAQRAGA